MNSACAYPGQLLSYNALYVHCCAVYACWYPGHDDDDSGLTVHGSGVYCQRLQLLYNAVLPTSLVDNEKLPIADIGNWLGNT